MDCIFCKIVAGQIPSKKVYEDERCLAFYDIEPQMPVHVLVIPKTHIPSVDAVEAGNADEVAHLIQVIPEIAKQLGIAGAYRIINNCGEAAGQTVQHLHFHLLGGGNMGAKLV